MVQGCPLLHGAGTWLLDSPHSLPLTLSYDGLVLSLQNLGSNIFLLQVLFGAVGFWARITTTLVLRFFGRHTTLAGSLAVAGLAILANMLVPQGAARAAGGKAEGLPARAPAGLSTALHPLQPLPLPRPRGWAGATVPWLCPRPLLPQPNQPSIHFPGDTEAQRDEARCPRSLSSKRQSQAWTRLQARGQVCSGKKGPGG